MSKDEDLMLEYISGNEDALNQIIRNNLSLVYSVAYYMTYDAHDAEDITQETFLKVWRYTKRYNPSQSFRGWLLTIARNTARDLLRKKRNIPFSEFESDDGGNVLVETLADDEPLSHELFERMEHKKMLDEIIETLPMSQREVIVLRYTSNMTFDEIGKVVGRPLHTVKSQHRRAVIEIKKQLHTQSRAPK